MYLVVYRTFPEQHISGEKLRSAVTVCQIQLLYGTLISSQTAQFCKTSPNLRKKCRSSCYY